MDIFDHIKCQNYEYNLKDTYTGKEWLQQHLQIKGIQRIRQKPQWNKMSKDLDKSQNI